MGASAAAISCYITALTQPPHLEAMAANMHPGDFYFDQWRIGGVFRFDNRIGWSVGMHTRTSPIDPGDPDGPSYERKRAVYEARFAHFGERVAAGKNAANLDWLTEMYAARRLRRLLEGAELRPPRAARSRSRRCTAVSGTTTSSAAP